MNPRKYLLTVGWLLLLLSPAMLAAADSAWTMLFNGRDLEGWAPVNGGQYFATNGCVHLSGGNGWLRSQREYTNFIFEAEWRATQTNYNSGFFLRAGARGSPFPDDVWQVNLKQSALGSLMKGPKTVLPSKTDPLPANTWCKFRIEARGPALKLYIDGRLSWEFDGFDSSAGFLGLQAEGKEFDFRNLRLQELP